MTNLISNDLYRERYHVVKYHNGISFIWFMEYQILYPLQINNKYWVNLDSKINFKTSWLRLDHLRVGRWYRLQDIKYFHGDFVYQFLSVFSWDNILVIMSNFVVVKFNDISTYGTNPYKCIPTWWLHQHSSSIPIKVPDCWGF